MDLSRLYRYPKKVLGKKVPIAKYLQIAEEKGVDVALNQLQEDYWRYNILSKSTYYRIRKKLLALKNQEIINYEKLFVEFLKAIVNLEEPTKSEVALRLGVERGVIDDLINWIKSNGLDSVVKIILKNKGVRKKSH